MQILRHLPAPQGGSLSQVHLEHLTSGIPGQEQPAQGLQHLGEIVVGFVLRSHPKESGALFDTLAENPRLLHMSKEDLLVADDQPDTAGFPDAIEAGKFKVYNLGNGEGFSVMQVIETCREVTGCDIPSRLAARRPGDPPRLVASSGRAAAELGWLPKYTELSEIASHAWAWHKSHPTGYEKA